MPFAIDPRDEAAAHKFEEDRQKNLAKQSGTLELANKAAAIHRLYPHVAPGVALSLAKAGATEATIKTVADAEAQRLINGAADRQARIAEADKPSGLGGAFKTGVKFAAAGLALPYELGVNAASQVFAGGDPGVANGFFISTSLGSLIKDRQKSGSGFFLGGEAQKNQADRARRYRGTVGGQAWTPGRGTAALVSEPGSYAYNILSGLVDAASVFALDPMNKIVPKALEVGAEAKGVTSWGSRGKILPLGEDVVQSITGVAKVAAGVQEVALADRVVSRYMQLLKGGLDQAVEKLGLVFGSPRAVLAEEFGLSQDEVLAIVKQSKGSKALDWLETAQSIDSGKTRGGTAASFVDEVLGDVGKDLSPADRWKLARKKIDDEVAAFTNDVEAGVAAGRDAALSDAGAVYQTAKNVDPKRAGVWLDSARGQRVTEKLAETATLAEVRKILPKAATRTQIALTDAKTPEEVRAVLAPILGLESGLIKPSDIKYKSIFSGQPSVAEHSNVTSMLRRAFGDPTGKMPSRIISLRASDRGIDDAVENVDRWLRSVGYEEAERAPVVEEFARAFTGVMDPEVKAQRMAQLQGAAESALDDQHRAKFQELLMLQDESTKISARAIAEGKAATEVTRIGESFQPTTAQFKGILTAPEAVRSLKSIFMDAVRFMEASQITIDYADFSVKSKLRVGIKNVRNGFDRFGNKVAGDLDFTQQVKDLAGMRRRRWVGFGESANDIGMGAYRGGTKNMLVHVDKAMASVASELGRDFNNASEYFAEFQRNADIIDTLRPFFKDPNTPRVPRRIFGDAGTLIDPQNLFNDPLYTNVSFQELIDAAYDKNVAATVRNKFVENVIDLNIEDAIRGNIPEFSGFTSDEIYAMWANALTGQESDALKQARALSQQIEATQGRLGEIEAQFKSVGLPTRGTGRADLYQVAEKFRDMIVQGLVKSGVDEDLAKTLLSEYYSNISDQALYAIDEAGNMTDFGLGAALLPNAGGDLVPTGGVMASPGLRTEMLSRHLFLPDPRRVRRLQGKLGWVTGVAKENPERFGELRVPLSALEWIQQEVWRPLTLMTGGYVLRNIAEEQARMTLYSRTSIFKHPLQHLMWAAGWKGAGDVLGNVYEIQSPVRRLVRGGQGAEEDFVEKAMQASQEEYVQALGSAYNLHGGDPIKAQMAAVRSGKWARAAKTERGTYIGNYADELRKLSDDPIAQMLAKGSSQEEILDWLRNTEQGRSHWNDLNTMAEGGLKFIDQTGKVQIVAASMLDERNLQNYIDRYVVGRLNQNAGEVGALPNDVLREVVAHGLVRNGAERVLTAEETSKLGKFFNSPTKDDVGNIYVLDRTVKRTRGGRKVEEVLYGKVTSVDEMGNRRMALMESAWDKNRNATPAFRKTVNGLLDDKATEPILPGMMNGEVKVSPGRLGGGRQTEAARRTSQAMDNVVNKFFGQLAGRSSNYLSRSPLFRQRYWEQVDQILPIASGKTVARLRDNVIAEAGRLGLDPADYVGSRQLWKRIEAVAPDRAGRLSLEQVDLYAKGHALDASKTELYNASNRNNLTDVARVIAPFGQAWGEILKTWTKAVTADPRILRRANVMIEGAKGADPDGDGRGFFYKDPTTGQYVFNYPLSDKFIGLLTGPVSQAMNKVPILNRFGSDAGGVNAALVAPIQTLSMGFSISPGLGPVAQIPASIILRNIPKAEEVQKFLMPYGTPALRGATFLPSWLQKFVSGVWDSPDTSRIMGQTYVEVVQHLYSSGDYNPSDINDRERMFEDAIGLARNLTVLRAFGQFIGPTRPSVEFMQGDLPVAFYASELRKLQDPALGGSYDTATSDFLRLYPDAVAYLGSKTKSVYGGLDITEEFGKWEEENSAVIKRYRDVGGLFAPYGTVPAMAVFSRQLAQGKRGRQTGREVIDEGEFNAANSIYKDAAAKFPGQRTDEQRALLRGLRDALGKKYPGFATLQSFDTRKFDRQISQLRQAVQDKDLEGNKVRDAAANYLSVRDQVLDIVQARGRTTLTSEKDADLRDLLRQYGQALVKKYPDFVRLYDRVLAREVESDTDPSGQ